MIFLHIMEQQQLEDLQQDIVRFQYYPIHSQKIRAHCHTHGFDDYIDGMDIFLNKEMIYIRTGTGKKEVYYHQDLENNIIELPDGQNFVNKVQKKFGNPSFNGPHIIHKI